MVIRCIVLAAAALLLSAPFARADSYFGGKTITLVTSTGAGGTYDVTARLIARHLPRHIPGNPAMIVQNMPGGGNVIATNFMYAIAPKDGTTIATIQNGIPLHQMLDGRGVRYDASKFNWLGSTGAENEVIIVWHTAGVRTIEDATRREVVLGGTGAGSGIVIIPTVMNSLLGTKFKMVMGYKSSEDVNLALQRGEVQARAFSFVSIVSQRPDWIAERKVSFLVQVGAKPDKALADVPLLTELAKTEDERRVLQLVSSAPGLGRPYVAPPGVPADRLAVLRKAFDATLRDKAFLAEAEKLQMDILEPMTGDDVARIVRDVINAPPHVVARAKAAVGAPER